MALGRSRIRHSGDTLVLALVSSELRQRLAARLGPVTMCESWEELSQALEGSPGSVAFLDPSLSGNFAELSLALRDSHPGLFLVPYTHLKPELVRRCLPLVGSGVRELVFAGFDDTRERLQRLIADAHAYSPSSAFEAALMQRLDTVPSQVIQALRILCEHPNRIRTADRLARTAGVSTRALFRYLKQAGIRSVRLLIAAPRVHVAHRWLADGKSVAEVSRLLGYSSADRLCEQFVALCGCTPTRARRIYTPSKLGELLVDALFAGGSAAPDGSQDAREAMVEVQHANL